MPRITLRDLETERPVSCPYTDALIGRDPSCPLLIDGPSARVVSGQHARVFFQDGNWWIQDLSRNGTVLDQERLIKGERHALRVDQVIGLGDSGPRLRVEVLESRLVAETLMEVDRQPASSAPSVPPAPAAPAPPPTPRRPSASSSPNNKPAGQRAAPGPRNSEAARPGLRIEEPTEPMKPSPDWIVHVVLRMTHTNQRFEVRGDVVRTGRSPDCAVQIPPELGASVSRVHAEIAVQDGGVVIRDAGSRNGTFVNGERILDAHPARRGDLVMLGPGGPTFTIDEIRIVKEAQQPRPKPLRPPAPSTPLQSEPDTEPPEGESVLGRVIRGIGKAFGK